MADTKVETVHPDPLSDSNGKDAQLTSTKEEVDRKEPVLLKPESAAADAASTEESKEESKANEAIGTSDVASGGASKDTDDHKTSTSNGGIEGSTVAASSAENGTQVKDGEVKDQNRKPGHRDQQHNNRGGGRGGNRGNYQQSGERVNYKDNVKSVLTSQEQSSDPAKIRKQVEFYFSDSNLPMDKFLFTRVGGHENHPVPISIIHSFQRMRHFQPFESVVAALKDSTFLDVVENDSCIRRKIPLSKDLSDKPLFEVRKVYEDKIMKHSIYAKGFGDEGPRTQFDIEAFFAKFGSTNSVRLRRAADKVFKGSVFVEFDSEETQKAFLALEPKPKWNGNDLQIKSKKQYCDDKVDDIAMGRIKPKSFAHPRDQKPNRNNDDRDWRERREDDRKTGFSDGRGGSHRGFGSSGRNRGSGRGGRGGRDRNDDRDRKRQHEIPSVVSSEKTPERQSEVENGDSKPAESTASPVSEKKTLEAQSEDSAPNPRKRTRDEMDMDMDGQDAVKKVDAKELNS